MNSVRRLAVLISAVLFITAASVMSFGEDPPSRAARLDYISGSVSVQPGGVNDWAEASMNRTLSTSDRIWADKDSRAELQLDTASMRLDSETSVTLTNVSDTSTQIELDQGALNVSIFRLFRGQIYEIDTPNVAFTILKPGSYRFDVDSNGDNTRVVVHHGEGEATGEGPAVRIHSKEGARFSGGRSMAHQMFDDPGYDGFDQWAQVRDKRQEHSVSAQYVAPGVVGYEDLDDYGYWRTIPPYGPVWVPTAVAPGWAPYSYGHWAGVAPWGWTWVDDAPWGYAPFHYGRGCYTGGYWGWVPGPVYVAPVWAPALVAWVGGPSWGISLGFGVGGGYGWFPLGWREPYYPWYGGSRNYFRNVNVSNTNITNITNITNNYYNNPTNLTRINYVNQRVPGAVTAVPAKTLVNGRPVQTARITVPPNQLRNATVMARPNVTPTQNAVLGVHAGARAAMPPAAAMNRPVVTRMTPPAPRQSFNGVREATTQANRPGQPRMNAGGRGQPGMNAAKPGQPTMNAAKPGMNAPKPGGPAGNTNMQGDRPVMVNDRPQFPANVHRPPNAGGMTSNARPSGPANVNAGSSNVPRPGNAPAEMNRGAENSGGAMSKNVQLNRNVPQPGETGGRPNAAVSNQGSGPRPGGQGSGYPRPNAGANTRVKDSGNMSGGQGYPRGNTGGSRVSEPAGRPSQQPKGGQERSTPKNEDHPKGASAGYGGGSYSTANAGGSYRYPRPQPGQVRAATSSAAQGSYGRSGQSTYARGSYGSSGANRGASSYGSSGYLGNRGNSSAYSSPRSGNSGYRSSSRASNSPSYGS